MNTAMKSRFRILSRFEQPAQHMCPIPRIEGADQPENLDACVSCACTPRAYWCDQSVGADRVMTRGRGTVTTVITDTTSLSSVVSVMSFMTLSPGTVTTESFLLLLCSWQ